MSTTQIDWSAMDMAERQVLVEHAMARLRGLESPTPTDDEGTIPTTPSWAALSHDEREAAITVMIAELRRAGAVPPERAALPAWMTERRYAVPTPMDPALHADSRPGDDRGDAKIVRRRRATELERLIRAARKRVGRGSSQERARWDAELSELNRELEQIREAERNERDEYRRV